MFLNPKLQWYTCSDVEFKSNMHPLMERKIQGGLKYLGTG
jgi:hypothetical protein